jgi:glutathione synthase
MRHLLLIDPIEKLNTKKDSSFMLALALQRRGIETYVFFENDFAITNEGKQKLTVHSFKGEIKADGFYMSGFETIGSKVIELDSSDLIHMRLDPPFDSRYLRNLWMLDHLAQTGIKVMNHPRGIMLFNEKLYAYRKQGSVASYVGSNVKLAAQFVQSLTPKPTALILKPMDLYSGIGVEKMPVTGWEDRFVEKVNELNGPVIVQPFIEAVAQGEVRSLYFMEKEIGTILKMPKEGEFLSNIAQGATFKAFPLSDISRKRCEAIVKELAEHGVYFVAFDILGDAVTEVNITCPGLLVEVSYAHQKNLSDVIIDMINQKFS